MFYFYMDDARQAYKEMYVKHTTPAVTIINKRRLHTHCSPEEISTRHGTRHTPAAAHIWSDVPVTSFLLHFDSH